MPADVGSQTISLKYRAPGNSQEINERFADIRPTGIYSGGTLTVTDATHASLAPLICEIGDGTHQVRVETTESVSVTVGTGTPYIVLRWSYTGNTSDYMEILAVSSGNVGTNDLVVAKCSFASEVLTGFDYGDTTHQRTVPNVQNLWLKVVPRGSGSLKAMVWPGWYQSHTGSVHMPLQETDALVPPSSSNKIYLVYLNTDTGAVAIDSTGTQGASPSAPDYDGRLVLAEITLASTDTEITAAKIKDVRPFITHGRQSVDGTTITVDADGKLARTGQYYMLTRTFGGQLSNQSSWTPLTNYGTVIGSSGITVATGGLFTLPAGRLYSISYNVLFWRTSGSPEMAARFRVISGDLSWWLSDDIYNNSEMEVELESGPDARATVSFTGLILPASDTVLRLEVKTRDAFGQYGEIRGCTLAMFTR